MLREIVLDTETTGLNARGSDRIIEIGCVELGNRIPTGREFHRFINPLRDVPAEAEAVHGISTQFLLDKPLFEDVAKDFLDFIADDTLVIHNASFDIGFLNAELERAGLALLEWDRVVDTLAIARRKHPAGPNNLDALCKRYQVDNSAREKHGALLDSFLLADVYIELLGERQTTLGLANARRADSGNSARKSGKRRAAQRPEPLPQRLSEQEIEAHKAFIETLGENAVWRQYS